MKAQIHESPPFSVRQGFKSEWEYMKEKMEEIFEEADDGLQAKPNLYDEKLLQAG